MAIIDSRGRPVTRAKKSRKAAPATAPSDELVGHEDRLQLVEIVTAAVKADRKQFGRADCARIAAAIFPRLNATQVSLLRDGAFGDVMARMIVYFEQKQRH